MSEGLVFEHTHPYIYVFRKERPLFVFKTPELILEFFKPYQRILEIFSAVEGYLALLYLLDREGDCPSVLESDRMREGYPMAIYRALRRVSLLEHSMNVARQMLKLIIEEERRPNSLIPKILVLSFGHDLGKLPSLRAEKGKEGIDDHGELGARMIEKLFSFSGELPWWFSSTLEMIRRHHEQVKDLFDVDIQRADTLARQEEATGGMFGFRSRRFEEWFDPKEFCEFIMPHINEVQYRGKWEAFSHDFMVYFSPYSLYEWAREFALKKKVMDMTLWRVLEKREALRRIVESFREAGFLSCEIPEGYIGRYYDVELSNGRVVKLFLTAIDIYTFYNFGVLPSKLEKRKMGKLSLIRRVSLSYTFF
jgi:hypothetical protein